MLIRFLFALIPLVCAAGAPTRMPRHYAYTGTDPALWTHWVLTSRDAATPGDFNVFPCGAPYCTVARVVTDAARNIYAVGSRTFAASDSASDVFVAKLDSAGATIFVATFSGKGSDTGSAIAVDPAGNIYAGGYTSSPNFPLRNAIQTAPTSGSYPGTGFLLKLSPDGSQLIYSTYFGGPVKALAADSGGNVYATGQTGWSDFPVTPGMPNGTINGDMLMGVFGAFVAKLNATGDKFLYSGRISGGIRGCTGGSSCFVSPRFTWGVGIALDAAGNAYVAGNANVTDLPTTLGVLSPSGIGAW
ncbi:MAG TPA: SBBP repeat-containing protein, partial [Terriglobales bacterium]